MTRPRYIEWTDKRGGHHIFDSVPLDFGAPDLIGPHAWEPEVRHYLNGREGITEIGPCWCRAPETHPIHEAVAPVR